MKKLELAVGPNNDPREGFKYIQFNTNGFVYATNGHIAVKCPVSDVLGEMADLPLSFYILGKDWGRFKFSTASRFELNEDRLIGFNGKQEELGSCKVLFEDEFINKVGRYPDIDRVLPCETKPLVDIPVLGINVELLSSVCKCLDFKKVKLSFRGPHHIVQVESNIKGGMPSKGYIMPLEALN
jgi:hypothetical protein